MVFSGKAALLRSIGKRLSMNISVIHTKDHEI